MSVRAQVSLIELENPKRTFAGIDCLRARVLIATHGQKGEEDSSQ